jgi:hypothetical protein
MKLLQRIATAKDRMKLRFILVELADNKRELSRCQRGSDAWVSLSSYAGNLKESAAKVVQRLLWAGIEYPQPMGAIEAWAICGAIVAALTALLAVILQLGPS